MLENCSVYKILWQPDSFVSRDSIFGLAGQRAGALFFARHRDYFAVIRNFSGIYLDLVPSRIFTVTRNSLPSTRTGKKQGTATQTAPNQTAGPLGLITEKSLRHWHGNCCLVNEYTWPMKKLLSGPRFLQILLFIAIIAISACKKNDNSNSGTLLGEWVSSDLIDTLNFTSEKDS